MFAPTFVNTIILLITDQVKISVNYMAFRIKRDEKYNCGLYQPNKNGGSKSVTLLSYRGIICVWTCSWKSATDINIYKEREYHTHEHRQIYPLIKNSIQWKNHLDKTKTHITVAIFQQLYTQLWIEVNYMYANVRLIEIIFYALP